MQLQSTRQARSCTSLTSGSQRVTSRTMPSRIRTALPDAFAATTCAWRAAKHRYSLRHRGSRRQGAERHLGSLTAAVWFGYEAHRHRRSGTEGSVLLTHSAYVQVSHGIDLKPRKQSSMRYAAGRPSMHARRRVRTSSNFQNRSPPASSPARASQWSTSGCSPSTCPACVWVPSKCEVGVMPCLPPHNCLFPCCCHALESWQQQTAWQAPATEGWHGRSSMPAPRHIHTYHQRRRCLMLQQYIKG